MASTAQRTRLCTATTKKGLPCSCFAIRDSEFCFSHDPALADVRKEARSKGGRARHGRKLSGDAQAPVTIDNLGDVVKLIVQEINAVRSLEKSISRARCVGYLANILANIYQASELERRLEALERVALP